MAFRSVAGLPSILKRRRRNPPAAARAVDDGRLVAALLRAGVERDWAEAFVATLRQARQPASALKAGVRALIHCWKINPALARREPRRLARAYVQDPAALAPDGMRKSIEAAREAGVRTTARPSAASDGLFSCGRRGCRSQRTAHWQRQSRSADEGMTVTVECLDCGFRYKV